MTERLYYADAYLREFDAMVVDRADGGRRIYLDRTAFYPTSGGQPHDTGWIDGIAVGDVIDEGERIAHVVAEPLALGRIRGVIDWPRRHDFMQQHTGQHLISAIFADAFDCQTASVHFGPELSTLDLDRAEIPEEFLPDVERRALALIAENRQVTVSFENAATAEGLRKPPTREGMLRVVSISGVDRSACGGTHVHATGAIGPLLLRRQERMRRYTRIEFVCGERALRRARRDYELLARIARGLSGSIDESPELVEGLSGQLKETQNRSRRLDAEVAAYRARERYESITPDAAGRRVAVERTASSSPDEWRDFAIAYSALPRAVFVLGTERPPGVLLAASSDTGLDAGRLLKAVVEAAGGRGGGSARLAQGSVPSAGAVDDAVRALQPVS
jgi:alanyl-tRNA synthetase